MRGRTKVLKSDYVSIEKTEEAIEREKKSLSKLCSSGLAGETEEVGRAKESAVMSCSVPFVVAGKKGVVLKSCSSGWD